MAFLTLYKYYNIFFLICQEVFFTNFNWAVARPLQSPLVVTPNRHRYYTTVRSELQQASCTKCNYFFYLFCPLTTLRICDIMAARVRVRGPKFPLYHIPANLSRGLAKKVAQNIFPKIVTLHKGRKAPHLIISQIRRVVKGQNK